MKRQLLLISLLLSCITAGLAQSNYLDTYIWNPVTLTTIGSVGEFISAPRDLDFKPNTNELWVVQYGNSNGGDFAIIYNAGQSNQWAQYRKDTHAGHFMIYPSAFCFGDNGEWANVNEIQNTSSPSSTFMGPSLWLGDTNIFARVFQNNWVGGYPLGSHIDMLHQSPFAMGIAHDSLKAYWVMDGWNGNICLYDYVNDHGPGYEDHSAGEIYRLTDVPVTREEGVPSHMVKDKISGWLYYIDGNSKQIRRLNTNTGSVTGVLTTPSTAPEALAGYYEVTGTVWERLDTLATQPCGMDYYNGRLVVSDYTTGDIYLYSTSPFALLGTIITGHPGMMGVKVGPDGHIWVVNNTENKVYRLDTDIPETDLAITSINSPAVENFTGNYYAPGFNVCSDEISPQITVTNTGADTITSADFSYSVDGIWTVNDSWTGTLLPGASTNIQLPSQSLANGSHLLSVEIINVNGSPDEVDLNNTMEGAFRTVAPVVPQPLTEGFSSNVFPPAGWNYIHHNKHNYMLRSTAGGFGASVGSMKMNNYYRDMNVSGQYDYLLSPVVDMSTASNSSWLRFSVAYARYNSTTNDTLQVWVSTDCGSTWNTVYNKAGSTLATASNTTVGFTPSASQWRRDSVSMSSYAGEAEVLVMFTSISNYGNNLYVDDIFMGDMTTGIRENQLSELIVYPNPATDVLTLELNNILQNGVIKITNVLGEVLIEKELKAGSNIPVNISELSQGYYLVTVQSGNSILNKSFIKN
jgi:hypothetical protein